MKSWLQKFVLLAMLGCAALVACSAQMNPIGRFAAMREGSEHCTGYSVELWKLDGKVYGLFRACQGMSGDTPIGTLENATLDPATHALAFEARLTVGSDYLGKGQQAPSKDVFHFEGVLGPDALTGKLTHEDKADNHFKPETTTVRLRKQKDMPHAYATPEAWSAANADGLKRNGPKW